MAVTASDIKALREKTGVGMLECKKALVETNGDMEKAISFLRERGVAAAEKKAGRIAAEGMVFPMIDENQTAVLIEVNTETDFAAKNEKFTSFVKEIASIIAKNNPLDLEALEKLPYGDGTTVGDELKNMILTIGENIKLRRFVRSEAENNSVFAVYNHHLAGKIGTLVKLTVSDNLKDNHEIFAFGKDLCMGVAANRPEYISREDIPKERLNQEKEILKAQVINEGKPEAIAEKIVTGKIGKFYELVCLVDQPYIRDQKIKVSEKLRALEKELGGEITVADFIRYECGEGIEKKSDDFASEVESMLK